MNKDKCSQDFTAQTFVANLLTRGSQQVCDETTSASQNEDLPSFYRREKFEKGQTFFLENMFGMCLSSFLGLLADLSNPTGLAVLIMTKKSGNNQTAYKRYITTIFHMIIWFQSDFQPGSRLWQSINHVKFKHNSASKKAFSTLNYRITQKDMVLAHWGFMGVAVCRPGFVGIYEENLEVWRSFVHFWRVIGHLLGITEEFNICKESLEETRAICHEIAVNVMSPATVKRQAPYADMCRYLVNGLWPLNPFLEYDSFMFYMRATLSNKTAQIGQENPKYRVLKWDVRLRLQIILITIGLMKFSAVRRFLNYLQIAAFWLTKRWPFLAYWKYGTKNANFSFPECLQ